MIGKSLMKQNYLKKLPEFYSNLNLEDITDAITCTRKEFAKTLK